MNCVVFLHFFGRNEKYLAAVAAGKWLVRKSYLEASREAGFFVDEEQHEWGVVTTGEPVNKLAAAARRWRLKLMDDKGVSPLILSLLSLKSTFYQHMYKMRKCIHEVARIGHIVISHQSKLWKAKFSILCDVIFLVRLQGKFDIEHS